jgi:hypothetical protein
MIHEELPALEASLIVIQKLAFGVHEFRALFTRSGGSMGCSCSCETVVVVVRKVMRGGFIGVVSTTRHVPSVLRDALILLPLGRQGFIASPHFVEPFTKVNNLVQLL